MRLNKVLVNIGHVLVFVVVVVVVVVCFCFLFFIVVVVVLGGLNSMAHLSMQRKGMESNKLK